MEINLSGVNVPTKVLNELLSEIYPDEKELYEPKLTPLIIAAASARISRDPRSIEKLIDEAIKDIPKAKKSAQDIAFGMGHHSIADHVLFNFSIENVSRLAIEAIEERRIGAGYTEKSQRYITLDGDFVTPEEFSEKDKERFTELVQLQNKTYFELKDKILENLKQESQNSKLRDLEGKAKEDARYVLSLATEGQLTCSYDGEAVEHAIRTMRYSGLIEVKNISKELEKAVEDYKEIVQLVDPETFKRLNNGKEPEELNFKFTKKNLALLAERTFQTIHPSSFSMPIKEKLGNVNLLQDFGQDRNITAALLYANSKKDIISCYNVAKTLLNNPSKSKEFMKEALKYLSEFDKVPREFEVGNWIFEADISSSCFAQLKRHRMATLLKQDYNLDLGVVIPDSILNVKGEEKFRNIIQDSSDLYTEFLPKYGAAAEYCLTNAHKRRVLFSLNTRELYHFSRTREDNHAQWEIRKLANNMCALAKNQMPITTILLGGKHEFDSLRKEIYGS